MPLTNPNMNKSSTAQLKPSLRSFTLLELIVVIVILGILATLGFTQYSKVVESSRLAEAKVMIGTMRQLATEYYWKNGSLIGIQYADVGDDDTCTSSNFYRYWIIPQIFGTRVVLGASRCTSGGKIPDASRPYKFFLVFYPASGEGTWHCQYDEVGYPSCLGYPQ